MIESSGEKAIIQNVQIAVVDHDRPTRDFIVDVMTYCVNRKVLAFQDAADVTTYIDRGKIFHLLLADVSTSNHNTFDLLKNIHIQNPRIYLIAMSTNPADQTLAESLGADVFLVKPFALSDLFKIVQNFVVEKGALNQL